MFFPTFPRFAIRPLLRGGVGLLLCTLWAATATAAELAHGQGLLWKIEKAGSQPSHLFGTIHVTDDRIVDLPAPVAAAFDEASAAVFELVLEPRIKAALGQSMVLRDGRTLQQILGAELFDATAAAAAPYGMPPQALQVFKPWALIAIFSYPPSEFQRITSGALPLDEWLQAEAAKRGKALAGLETLEEQLALFDGLPESTQVSVVQSMVRDSSESEQRFAESIELYLARNLSGLHRLLVEEPGKSDPAMMETFETRFIEERNRRMVDRMQGLLARGDAFVAVGALHLPGEKGMLQLLADQGYKITRVY